MPISKHNIAKLKRDVAKLKSMVADIIAIVDKDGMVKHCTPVDFDDDLIERHGVSYYTRAEAKVIGELIQAEKEMYEDRMKAPINTIPSLAEYVKQQWK